MTHRAGMGEDSQRPTPAVPEAIAHWLLAAEAGKHNDPEELAAVGERIYHRLRTHLMVLLGTNGFDALWARAMHLAQPFPATTQHRRQQRHVRQRSDDPEVAELV